MTSRLHCLTFQSTLPVGGATAVHGLDPIPGKISIHAPRGGSDIEPGNENSKTSISIHAPRGGSDSWLASIFQPVVIFQSTLPVGGATLPQTFQHHKGVISIHAPRGGSDTAASAPRHTPSDFNPRSPWGERLIQDCDEISGQLFQSTLPVGGATIWELPPVGATRISIHAPRGGSDIQAVKVKISESDFNPRSPWGERPAARDMTPSIPLFQSTLPVGGATKEDAEKVLKSAISIHAPRGGSDPAEDTVKPLSPSFQSTLPVGGATRLFLAPPPVEEISIHAPRGGSDPLLLLPVLTVIYFNPRSPWGERRFE